MIKTRTLRGKVGGRERGRGRGRYAVRKICQGKLDWVKYDYVTKMPDMRT